MPYVLYNFLDCYLLDNSVAMCTDRVSLAPVFLMYITISCLNLYWFSQMISGALSFLIPGEKPQDSKKGTPLDNYKTN